MAGEELWAQCCEWFKRVGLISSDHLLATDHANTSDLFRFLRDGVMLCKLLHHLDNTSIELRIINQRPHKAQFLCLKNITIFLLTCEQVFGIHKNDLFEPHMLFEGSDFRRVLQTLSKLSNSPKALRSNVPGFPEEGWQNDADDHVYEMLDRDMANDPAGDGQGTGMRSQEAADDYTIYAKLKLDSRYQRLFDDDDGLYEELTNTENAELSNVSRKRDLCLKELVDTEYNYVEALKMVCAKFIEPLRAVLSDEQIDKIFGKIPELVRIHHALHVGLEEARNNNAMGKTIADVFLDNQERLTIYADYCANISAAQMELEDVMSNNEEARNLIQECQNNVNRGHHLKGYLLVPLQRILKYHLFLQELDSHKKQHPNNDLGDLNSAYEAMSDLAGYINEATRDREFLQIIQDVQTSILNMPSNITDWRDLGKLKHDGETKVECHPKQMSRRYVFIFEKVMLICKQTKDEKYTLKDLVKLENCHVDNAVGAGQGGTARGRQNTFYLVEGVNRKAYTIHNKDSASKEKWMKCISDAIEYLNPSKNRDLGHNFAISTFSKPTRCRICRKLLKGTIFPGYRCSKCEMIVDRSCINEVQKCEGCVRPETFTSLPHQPIVRRTSDPYPGYGDLSLLKYPWWVGKMTRLDAQSQLQHQPEGTFLVRWSEQHKKLVLSLKFKDARDVKHMRVFRHEEANSFYLSEVRYFSTVESLVNFYRENSLSECFSDLFAKLSRPIYNTAVARYRYEGLRPNYLSLEVYDRVIVISTEAERIGWWKGRIEERTGYFPKSYVEVENNSHV